MPTGGNASLRIDKVLSHMGLGTRTEIKRMARGGMIKVNGEVVKDSGQKIDPFADRLEVGGEPIRYRESIYVMMNKPQGVLSATEDRRDRTVVDLLPGELRNFEPFPVGRLDKDTEGLLLLTNDGALAHNLLSPRKHVPKLYYAEVAGKVGDAERLLFREGVALDDGYVTMPADLQILNAEERFSETGEAAWFSSVELTIAEGKFHQIKRMFAAVGMEVVYLKRLAMGRLRLDERLRPGEWRELTEAERLGLGVKREGE